MRERLIYMMTVDYSVVRAAAAAAAQLGDATLPLPPQPSQCVVSS